MGVRWLKTLLLITHLNFADDISDERLRELRKT
jgi:hypothetical protein